MGRIHRIRQTVFRFITRPVTGFISHLLVVAFVVLVPLNGPNLVILYLVLPWLALAAVALNMSFVSMVCRRFTLSPATKRNHALEHGTIFFLRRRYGGKARIGGSAERGGFRICGVHTKEHLVIAFDDLVRELKKGNSDLVISLRCGTNMATAQGLGVIMLSLTAFVLLVTQATPAVSLAALCINVLLYCVLRARLGNWVQSRFFMSVDFSEARIRSVYRVKKTQFWERDPVFFVKTAIS